jgi:hypothetical protein
VLLSPCWTYHMTKSTNLYIHARVSQALAATIQQLAQDDERSQSSIIRCALKEYLKARGYDPDAG